MSSAAPNPAVRGRTRSVGLRCAAWLAVGVCITVAVSAGWVAMAIWGDRSLEMIEPGIVWKATGFRYEVWPLEDFRALFACVPLATAGSGTPVVGTRVSVGWPLTVLQSDLAWPDDPSPPPGFIRMHASWSFPEGLEPRLRAYRVLWLNLLCMGMLTGTLSLGVVSGARSVVANMLRRHRGRLGKCVSCGYDKQGIDGLPCPECGHERT